MGKCTATVSADDIVLRYKLTQNNKHFQQLRNKPKKGKLESCKTARMNVTCVLLEPSFDKLVRQLHTYGVAYY